MILTALVATGSAALAQTTTPPSGGEPTDQPSTIQQPGTSTSPTAPSPAAPEAQPSELGAPTMVQEPELATENDDLSRFILALNNVTLNTYIAALQQQRAVGGAGTEEALQPEKEEKIEEREELKEERIETNDRDLDGIDDTTGEPIDGIDTEEKDELDEMIDESLRPMDESSPPRAPDHSLPSPSVEP
jgi:hypothetical protein